MKHFVHVYCVVRVKVEVDACTHEEAMTLADGIVTGDGFQVRLSPMDSRILEAESAEEVTGYLVDPTLPNGEIDYAGSRSYGADGKPE